MRPHGELKIAIPSMMRRWCDGFLPVTLLRSAPLCNGITGGFTVSREAS